MQEDGFGLQMLSRTNLRKFGRDLAVAVFGFTGTYIATNFADIGLSPGVAVAILPVYLYGYRMIRERLGLGPES